MSEAEADEKPGENSDEEKEGEGETSAKKELTAEEQMAAYEEALKETDWGHQPC